MRMAEPGQKKILHKAEAAAKAKLNGGECNDESTRRPNSLELDISFKDEDQMNRSLSLSEVLQLGSPRLSGECSGQLNPRADADLKFGSLLPRAP